MKLKVFLSAFAILLSFLCSAALYQDALAATDVGIKVKDLKDRNAVDPGVHTNGVVGSILNGVYQISGIVAVLMLVISGIRYITSDGDPGRTQSARKGIIYALIGLVIIGSAFIITGVIIGLFK